MRDAVELVRDEGQGVAFDRANYHTARMSDSDAEELREALRQHIRARGLSVNAWAQQAGITESTLRNFLAGRSETITYATLVALSRASGLWVGNLLPPGPATSSIVNIGSETNSEEWRKSGLYSLNLDVDLPIDPRFPGVERFGVLVGDNSFDVKFRKESIVVCVKYESIKRKPAAGDYVLCVEWKASKESKHTQNGYPNLERRSIRQIVEAEGSWWLVLRSTSPRWHQPIKLPSKSEEKGTEAPLFLLQDRAVLLGGLVVGSYQLE